MSFNRVLAALALAFSVALTAPAALAQSAPSAAPTSGSAEAQPLDAPSAAPTANVDVTTTGGSAEGALGNISIVSLFMRADPLVKGVFVLLVAASLWSWTNLVEQQAWSAWKM